MAHLENEKGQMIIMAGGECNNEWTILREERIPTGEVVLSVTDDNKMNIGIAVNIQGTVIIKNITANTPISGIIIRTGL